MTTLEAELTRTAEVPATPMSITPISDGFGVEVSGIDLSDPHAVDAAIEDIKSLISEHQIVVFRDQHIEADPFEAFGSRFGEFARSVTQYPDGTFPAPIHTITNLDSEGRPSKSPHGGSNYLWHSDRAFFPNGVALVMLHAVELPPKGGDTQWVNVAAAYDGLSDADKELVGSLQVVHSFDYMRSELMKRPLTDAERKIVRPTIHPLVRVDPVNGRKSLLLGMYACEIVGMATADGRALIERLQAHATQEKFMYTHEWRPGDFAVWDNLTTMHRAVPNYDMEGYRRIMMRCSIEGHASIAG